jgi:hypothetical protein
MEVHRLEADYDPMISHGRKVLSPTTGVVFCFRDIEVAQETGKEYIVPEEYQNNYTWDERPQVHLLTPENRYPLGGIYGKIESHELLDEVPPMPTADDRQ